MPTVSPLASTRVYDITLRVAPVYTTLPCVLPLYTPVYTALPSVLPLYTPVYTTLPSVLPRLPENEWGLIFQYPPHPPHHAPTLPTVHSVLAQAALTMLLLIPALTGTARCNP